MNERSTFQTLMNLKYFFFINYPTFVKNLNIKMFFKIIIKFEFIILDSL